MCSLPVFGRLTAENAETPPGSEALRLRAPGGRKRAKDSWRRGSQVSERMKFKDVRHIVHAAIILVVVVVGFLIARWATVPKSFGQYGHYRGASIAEDQSFPVILQSAGACKECHEKERGMWPGFDVWQKGKHSAVTCENCHSNVRQHVERMKARPESKEFLVTKDPKPQRCLMCHFALAARPKVAPLCVPDDNHAEYLKLIKEQTEEILGCTTCHEDYLPHNPKLEKKQ